MIRSTCSDISWRALPALAQTTTVSTGTSSEALMSASCCLATLRLSASTSGPVVGVSVGGRHRGRHGDRCEQVQRRSHLGGELHSDRQRRVRLPCAVETDADRGDRTCRVFVEATLRDRHRARRPVQRRARNVAEQEASDRAAVCGPNNDQLGVLLFGDLVQRTGRRPVRHHSRTASGHSGCRGFEHGARVVGHELCVTGDRRPVRRGLVGDRSDQDDVRALTRQRLGQCDRVPASVGAVDSYDNCVEHVALRCGVAAVVPTLRPR